MTKKNILHIVEYLHLGGIERLLEQLASNSFEKSNVYFLTYETDTLSGIGKQIQDKGFPVFCIKKKKGRDWSLVKKILRMISENKIDVVHTHDFGPMEYAVLLKILRPWIRLVHTQHTLIHFIRNKKYTTFFQFASFFYYRIIAVSFFVKNTILEYCFFMKRSVLIVIPNGVDTAKFVGGIDILPNKEMLRLVSVCRISNEKNLNYILNTCRLLKNEKIPFVFHHAGSAKSLESQQEMESYIKVHGLEDNVFLHGFCEDAKEILNLGDVFLSASKTEGHPVSVLEAMACEKVCFCSDILPHRELGDEVVNFFDINIEDSLLNSLLKYNSSNDEKEEFARVKIARIKIVENFSIEKMVGSYVEQYS
jgi:glycosyltransferase involved in cell wall biosynthesis